MRQRMVFALVLLVGTACATETPDAPESPQVPEAAGEVEAAFLPYGVEALEVRNVRAPAEGLLTGGQLSREQMSGLRDLGFRTFISLRPADESGAGWEEEFAGAEGIDFARLPIAGSDAINRENAERLAEMIERNDSGSTVVYCGSGNRVGALLAVAAHFRDGMSPTDALAYGQRAGLTRLEPKVREVLNVP